MQEKDALLLKLKENETKSQQERVKYIAQAEKKAKEDVEKQKAEHKANLDILRAELQTKAKEELERQKAEHKANEDILRAKFQRQLEEERERQNILEARLRER